MTSFNYLTNSELLKSFSQVLKRHSKAVARKTNMQLNCKPAASVLNREHESLGLECAGQCSKPSGQTFYIWSQNCCLKNALNASQCCTQVPAKTALLHSGPMYSVSAVKGPVPFPAVTLISQTSSLLPPSLPRRRPGRTNTAGYSTPRQELPDSESTTERKPERRLSVCQGHGIAGQRLRAALPGGVFQRDRSAIDQRCLTERTTLGRIYPYCLKFFTSHLEKPFNTFSSCIRKNPFYCFPLTLHCCFSYFV